jgi:hypothetical protein
VNIPTTRQLILTIDILTTVLPTVGGKARGKEATRKTKT